MSGREITIFLLLCSCSGNKSGSSDSGGRDEGAGAVYEDSIPPSEDLMGASHQGKWGYVNTRPDEVIPFQFVGVSAFKDGRAVVEVSGDDWSRFKYIDKAGKITGEFAPQTNRTYFTSGDAVYGNMPEGVFMNDQQEEESEADRIRAGNAMKVGKSTEGTAKSTVNMFTGKWLPVVAFGRQGWVLDLYLLNFNPKCEAAGCETWIMTKSNKADESYSQAVLQKFSSGAMRLRNTGFEKSNGKAIFPGLSIGQVVLYYFMTNPNLKHFQLTYSLDVHYDNKKNTLAFSKTKDKQGNLKTFSLSASSPGLGNADFDFVQESDGVVVTERYSIP